MTRGVLRPDPSTPRTPDAEISSSARLRVSIPPTAMVTSPTTQNPARIAKIAPAPPCPLSRYPKMLGDRMLATRARLLALELANPRIRVG